MATLGQRAKDCLAARSVTQKSVAEAVGMSPDALSRSLNDERNFTATELAALADLLDEDLRWLITGEHDPFRAVVAARHDYDQETRQRSVPGAADDRAALRDIELAYRQAYLPGEPVTTPLPKSAKAARAALGEDFVRPFIRRLESALGVDVVRYPGLSTAWSFVIGGRPVIAIPTTSNWFRENFDLAHELAHLSAGHHGGRHRVSDEKEGAANAFAAGLLMPKDELTAVDWQAITLAQLARLVWDLGVSTTALANRLSSLRLAVSDEVAVGLDGSTPSLLRRHLPDAQLEIARRSQDAAVRQFPARLIAAHEEKIAQGALGRSTLAWMLAVEEDQLQVEMPAADEGLSSDELLALLG